MKDLLSAEKAQEIIDALDEAIQDGPWSRSNFLAAIGKNLQDMREEMAGKMAAASSVATRAQVDPQLASRMALRKEQVEIFVALYCSDGQILSAWERLIANLPKQIVSRPIYADEESVKSVIRNKDNIQNEAYVSVYVNPQDLLSLTPDRIPKDKLGQALLTLKDNSLLLENVNRFVHLSGIYQYTQGRLVLVA